MKRWILVTITAGAALAQSNLERGKKILDDTLAALGGQKFLEMRDRVEKGRAYSFYRERLSGLSQAAIYTRYLTRPEPPVPGSFWQRERQSFGENENSGAVLFAEEEGWDITYRGARPMAKDLYARYRDSTLRNIFYILRQRLGEKDLIIEFQSTDIFDNQPVEIVNVIDADNRSVSLYIQRSTRLPVRQIYYRRNPVTKERTEEETLFGKYRDVGGGVQWPFTIQRFRNGEKIYAIYAESVVINQNLTDDLFSLSDKIKVLPPAK
jgi:hypothetical protein